MILRLFITLIEVIQTNLILNLVENTILVEPWVPGRGRKQDRTLQECIDIIESLRCVANLTDVRKSLRSIIDTNKPYKH
jgi:hypothetical protein